MIFLQHNFVGNYKNAIKSKDSRLVNNLIIGELSKVLVSNKKAVMDILRKNNVAVSKLESNRGIADIIIRNIEGNPKLLQDISNLLINYTKMESKAYGFNICGEKEPTEKVADHPEFTFALRNGMRSHLTEDNRLAFHNAIGVNEKLQNVVEKSKVKKLWQNKKVKVITYLGLAVLVGYGLSILYKKYSAKQMASGGEIEGDGQKSQAPVPEAPPIAPIKPSVPINPNVNLV